MSAAARGRLELLAAAVLFSTGGAAIKATTLTSWQVAGFRSLIAALAVALFIPASRRRWSWRVLVVAAAYASTLVLFVLANKLTTAANAIFLQASGPLYLLLLGPLLLREPIRRSDVLLILVMAGGMGLFFVGEQAPSRTAPDPWRGNLLGAFSGLSWALTIAGLRWIAGRAKGSEPGMAAVAAGNVLAGLVCLPKALPVAQAASSDWVALFYLGVFQVGLAYLCLTRGVRQATALEASLLLLAEPALNPIWAWLVHAERPGAFAILGGMLILVSSLLRAVWTIRRE
jgi:drug/metabolite transporter (DMT)-like permease